MRKKKKSEYLRIIFKEDLFKTKLVTDNEGNTKEIIIKPKKVLI